jgi:hypothetical protein
LQTTLLLKECGRDNVWHTLDGLRKHGGLLQRPPPVASSTRPHAAPCGSVQIKPAVQTVDRFRKTTSHIYVQRFSSYRAVNRLHRCARCHSYQSALRSDATRLYASSLSYCQQGQYYANRICVRISYVEFYRILRTNEQS